MSVLNGKNKKTFFFVFVTTLLSRRRFSSSSPTAINATAKKLPRTKFKNKVRTNLKLMAMEEARKALREYLHATKSLPFVFAELIAENSPFSLNSLFSKILFSRDTFASSFRSVLRYEPINEFEFLFESIGIDYSDVHRLLPNRTHFFSQDRTVFDAICGLSQFGFPWNSIGKLFVGGDISILRRTPAELRERLFGLKERYGFDNLSVVGIILAFPHLLIPERNLDFEEEIFHGLKRVFAEFEIESCVEGNVDEWYEVCCKVRVFFDLGCDRNMVIESMCEHKDHFLKCPFQVLVRKVEYFRKFGAAEADVGSLLLLRPRLSSLDLETPAVSILGFLEHFGLEESEVMRVTQKYPHFLGRNRMANLPNSMKALELHEWCFDKVKSSKGELLVTYRLSYPDEGIDKEFLDAWKRIESLRYSSHTATKMEFLKSIGFGENILTIKKLQRLRGVGRDLQERFDCLVRLGFEHSKLCFMVRRAPEILCQSSERLEEKVHFWRRELGLPIDFLVSWPKYLFHLNVRIERRFGVYFWLRDLGLSNKHHSISRMIECSEKRFVERLFRIHPAAPKHYFECF